ncbi:virulence-associated E family protein [Clostridium sp. C2-6-12]|uniref:virulence-associated E family protein n=1 Tax=Clostridium sp. C2-6-12 TaxID=2698832 RepID=UPI001369B485|nr:virulence-associated E family protein [Clostridium sp. C2-6-12]
MEDKTIEEFNHKKIKYDGQVSLATGRNKTAKQWKNRNILYSALVEKLSSTTRTPETYAEYKKMPKADRDRIKDVGGFVGGSLKNGRRKAENVANRTLLTLDLDYVVGDIWSSIELLWDFSVVMYSTHTHASDNQRLRIVIPLSRPVLPDEYQAIARMIADDLGIDQFDDTTYEPCRLMYWPSTSSDGEYIFKVQDLEWLNPDEILERYTFGWQDVSYWPESSRARAKLNSAIKKQEDPLEKKGVIGAFCRTYSISEAIGEFLSDVYAAGADDTRYTFSEGSTSGGLVVYDDKFSFSHHGTDPTSGILCNAFDLIRIHKFGELDDNAKENTPANRLPSFIKMTEFASSDKKVKETIGKERMEKAQEDFDIVVSDDEMSTEWLEKLQVSDKGRVLNISDNYVLIIDNEPLLKCKIAYNEFTNKIVVNGELPWRKINDLSEWNDTDDAGLRTFIEKYYGISNISKYNDAISLVVAKNSFHPVKHLFNNLKWDKVQRIETLLIDYLGAEDTLYTRFIMKKWLVAGVARIYRPGTKFDNMPILSGPQGIGKSTFFKKLGMDWFSDNNIDLKDTKKAIEVLRGKLIVEMAELSNMKRADVEVTKNFITRIEFEARPAYGKRNIILLIQWLYCGTTNDKEFLKDKTGNRRFWPVDVKVNDPRKSVFKDLSREVVLQIWAEAIELYRAGYIITLNEEEEKQAKVQQELHMETDELEQILEDKLNWDAPKEQWDKYTFTEIVVGLNLTDRQSGYARQNLKTILAKKGIEPDSRRKYIIPPRRMLKAINDFEVVSE